MRVLIRVAVGLALAAATLSLPGTAQGGTPPAVTLNVTKVVAGDVPAGTTFDVQIDCDTPVDAAPASEGGPTTQTITFDAAGGQQSVSVPQFQPVCTVTEIEDGGADSVVYSAGASDCEITPSDQDISVSYGRATECGVTITNTFPDAPPPPEPPPVAQPAAAAQAQPAFTG